MTEDEWAIEHEPERLVRSVQKDLSKRKERLFAVAVCYWIEGWWPNPEVREVVELAERFADGAVSQDELEQSVRLAARRAIAPTRDPSLAEARRNAASAITLAAGRVTPALWALQAAMAAARQRRLEQLVGTFTTLFRDIVCNPFRPVTLDPRWLSSTVLDLARTTYDERVFERMPILGDALMDAGCDNETLIQHCQGPGPHVRGCWVVDLLLGKT